MIKKDEKNVCNFFDKISSERDFQEDFEHENGCYQNKCVKCNQLFLGHKYRRICKTCCEIE